MNKYMICIAKFLIMCAIVSWVDAQNSCSSSPCRAPSECENLEDDYVCHCKTGIKGKSCNMRALEGEDLCQSSPCWNGGTCENLGNAWRCTCAPGNTGKNCRTIESVPCVTNNPCRNNANCRTITSNGELQAVCSCLGDWTGQFCETPLSFCERPNPCYNRGVCVNNACECPKNFTGQFCETYSPPKTDKVIKIYSKGLFYTNLYVYYEQQAETTRTLVQQTGSLLFGQDYAFYVPEAVHFETGNGVILVADAYWGGRILTERIKTNPECYHIWGFVFAPHYSRVECW